MEWFESIAKRVRSPRGEMADKEAVYQELCQRLGIEQQEEKRPAIRPLWRRVAVAACALLIVSIGIAGIYHYQLSTEEAEPVSSVAHPASEKLGPLVFEKQPLAEIATVLTQRFGIEVSVTDKALAQYRMTASFTAEESLPEILSSLATAGHFHFCKTDRGYSLVP